MSIASQCKGWPDYKRSSSSHHHYRPLHSAMLGGGSQLRAITLRHISSGTCPHSAFCQRAASSNHTHEQRTFPKLPQQLAGLDQTWPRSFELVRSFRLRLQLQQHELLHSPQLNNNSCCSNREARDARCGQHVNHKPSWRWTNEGAVAVAPAHKPPQLTAVSPRLLAALPH